MYVLLLPVVIYSLFIEFFNVLNENSIGLYSRNKEHHG